MRCPSFRANPEARQAGSKARSIAPMADSPAIPSEAPAPQVIALVDDDRNILTTVSIGLQAEGFITRVYSDGKRH